MFQKADLKVEVGAGIALILLTGCTSKPSNFQAVAEPPALEVITPRTDSLRTLKLKLTLDNPQDLKVSQNDWVIKGQTIGDRTSERTRLGQEKQKLILKLNGLKSADGKRQQSYAVERAKVEDARRGVVLAWDAVEQFKKSSPWTDYAQEKVPLPPQHQAQLIALQAKYQGAKGLLEIARAELSAAREQKTSTKQDTSVQQSQILNQLQSIEVKLTQLGTVRSPYDGQIKTVKWLGQTDQQLQVEVALSVNSQKSQTVTSMSPSPTQSPEISAR